MAARLLLLFVAGGFGTVLRYLVTLGCGKWLGPTFPWGTLAVNLAGCFLIAAIVHASLATTHVSDELRLVLTTGLMGGLTTYSAFNLDATTYLRSGTYTLAGAYIGSTILGCFAAGLLGLLAARAAFGS
jgi:fluoride exporter